jgi:C-terminal, D2-small domain, of ClpB protein
MSSLLLNFVLYETVHSPMLALPNSLGAQVIADLPSYLKGSEPEVHNQIMEVVRQRLSPELLNRIDETVVFNRLQRENMDTITQIGISEIDKRMQNAQNMTLDVSDAAASMLSEMGYDVRYGARPLKRTLNRELLNPLSRLVLEGSIAEGDTVRVRTRAEAEKLQREAGHSEGWITRNPASDSKNDIVILKNHSPQPEEEETWDDKDFLLEDGTHSHR